MQFFSLDENSGTEAALAATVLLLEQRASDRMQFVAVDGPSGSGKSTFAAALATLLGAPLLAMDDLYPGWDGLAEAVPLVARQVLEPLARGEPAAYRRWDWIENHWAETVPVPATPVLVVEGVGSSVPPAGDFAVVRVWLEADPSVRMARGIARDGQEYRPHWERWARQENEMFAADGTRDRADVIVQT